MFLHALKGKTDEAREMGQEALQIFRKALGDDHPNTKIVKRAWGRCSVAAERLATAMGLTVRPDAKPVPTLQADHWTRWLQPPTHNDDVDVELGTQDGGRITVLLASLGRCVTGSEGGWVQKRTSFLERQDECSVTAGQPEQPPS